MWITGSCDQNHTSSGSTQTTQPPENAMGAESLTTLETTTVQTFTTRYSQPGHFGLLMVSLECERVMTQVTSLSHVVHAATLILYMCIGSHWYSPPSCVWCSPARCLLCWTGHLFFMPYCIHDHTPCIQVRNF